MKLNNKGFAISTILYGLLALLILIIMLIFQIMRTNNNNNKALGEATAKELSLCRDERINYANCLSTECSNLKKIYEECLKNQ